MQRYVIRTDDHSPVPEIGLVVGTVDDGVVAVAWGDEKYADLPRLHAERMSTLILARPVVRAR